MISAALDEAFFPSMSTTVLLETMAGKGSEIGGKFEEIKNIFDCVKDNSRIGVCLDSCHIWDAGYDISADLDAVLDEFDRVIGLERLKAVHLNGSLNALASHKDRHAAIGDGMIETDTLKALVNNPRLQGKPFILETPNDDAGYMREISTIKKWNYGN